MGLAWVALHGGHHYSVDLAGEVQRVPTLTRGALAALDDQLAKLTEERTWPK